MHSARWRADAADATEAQQRANESLAAGLLPLPELPTRYGSMTESDDWVDIRTVDFAEAYSAEYGNEWKKDW
jgi:hypothetical protein